MDGIDNFARRHIALLEKRIQHLEKLLLVPKPQADKPAKPTHTDGGTPLWVVDFLNRDQTKDSK
jgi:hypothetical protein